MLTAQNTKRILIFIVFAFGIPWSAALVIYLSGMMDTDAIQAVGLANTFFIATPWLANILTRLVTREGWGNLMLRPNFKRGWRFYVAAWLLPLLATLVGAAIFYLVFPQSFDPNLGAVQKLIANTPSAAASPWLILLSLTLSMVLLTVPINTVISLGEELGWRGYLLPKLVEQFGGEARNAALLTGVIHGVWHWPLLIMSASFTPGATFLTPLVYLVFTCSLSILISWAALRSGSVWPAAIGHGAANPFSTLPAYLLNGAPIPLMGPDATGLLGGIGYTILALVLFFSRKAFAGKKEAASERMERGTAAV